VVVHIEGALGIISPLLHGSSVLSLPSIHGVELFHSGSFGSLKRFGLSGVWLNGGLHKIDSVFWDINEALFTTNIFIHRESNNSVLWSWGSRNDARSILTNFAHMTLNLIRSVCHIFISPVFRSEFDWSSISHFIVKVWTVWSIGMLNFLWFFSRSQLGKSSCAHPSWITVAIVLKRRVRWSAEGSWEVISLLEVWAVWSGSIFNSLIFQLGEGSCAYSSGIAVTIVLKGSIGWSSKSSWEVISLLEIWAVWSVGIELDSLVSQLR